MTVWELRGLVLDHCHACKGLWFDAGELEDYLARSHARFDESALERIGETAFTCPRCRPVRLVRAYVDTVALDVCPRCRGNFLDLGEVHALLGAVCRREYADDPALSKLDNQALGLYIAARVAESAGASADRAR